MQKTFLLFFLALSCSLSAQSIRVNDTVPQDSLKNIQVVLNHLQQVTPTSTVDSAFFESFNYLVNFTNSDTIKQQINFVKSLVSSNKPYQQILELFKYRNKVDSLNQQRRKYLSDYWQKQRLQAIADTSDIASTDSIFSTLLDSLFYQDTLNIDSIIKVYEPYNDSVLEAIDQSIDAFFTNANIRWIKKTRGDTTNFYLVDLEGDSLLIPLYKNSPEMIRFALTDYWGNSISAVIRDIERKSFKILIDHTPELNYETHEKAKKAIGSMGRLTKARKLSIEKIPNGNLKPKWLYGGNANFDLSQVAVHQWAQGGESSISLLSGLELFANYKHNNISWENKARFRYGVIRQGRYADNDVDFRANEDRIELNSKYGRKAFGHYYITIMGDFKSQFAPTYNYEGTERTDVLSKFMNPGYATFALGLDYKPEKNMTFFLSPITSKSTFVLDTAEVDQLKYGVDSTATARHEMGAIFKATHKMKVWGEIEMENQLELFTNYLDKPQNIDVDWEFKLILPVNDFIRATIATKFMYDHDTKVPKYTKETNDETGEQEWIKKEGRGGQFREMLTVGFAMKF